MNQTKISVIIPVYNEARTVEKLLAKVLAVNLNLEIILVDDASTDESIKIVLDKRNKEQLTNLKLIRHEKNKGKGYAIRTGLKEVTGKIVIIQDADLEYDPEDYYELIKPIESGEYKVVYGSRNLRKENIKRKDANYYGNKLLTFVSNVLYGARITDEATCYKVFETKAIKSLKLKCKRFEFCPEVTAKVRKKGYKIKELPISYEPRSIAEGKKINWKDGIEALWTLIKFRFSD